MADRSVRVVLSAVTSAFEQGMARAAAASKRLGDDLGSVMQASERQRAALDGLGRGATVAGGLVAAGLGAAIKSYADFDEAMSAVAATGQDAKANIQGLRDAAMQAGADTKYSATEAAQGVEAMSKAGMHAKDIMGGGLTSALNLAASGNMSVADSADFMATALNNFHMPGTEAARVADAIAAGANKAQGDVSDMALAFSYVAIPARDAGMSVEQTAGAIAQLASQGIIGEKAGTGLRGVLMSLEAPSTAADKAMAHLGITLYDGNGKFLGYDNAVQQLHDKLGPLTDAQRDQALGTIFGNEQIGAARVLMSGGAAAAQNWAKEVAESGYAQQLASEKTQNLKGDIERLGGSAETAFMKLGESSNGPLRDLVKNANGVVDAFGNMDSHTQATLSIFAGVAGGGALAAGGLIKIVSAARNAKEALGDALGPVLETHRTRMAALQDAHPRVAAGLSGLAKAAGIAGAALAAMQVYGVVQDLTAVKLSADDAAVALGRMGKSGDLSQIDVAFKNLSSTTDIYGNKIKDLPSSMQFLAREQNDSITKAQVGFENLITSLTGVKGAVALTNDAYSQMDAGLAKLDPSKAAQAFSQFAEQAKLSGVSVETMTARFPEYAAKLADVAKANGVEMTSAEAMSAAMDGSAIVTAKVTDATGAAAASAGTMANAQNVAALAAGNLEGANLKVGESLFKTSGGAQILIDANGKVADSMDAAATADAAYAKALEHVQEQQNNVASGAIGLSGSMMSLQESYEKATAAAGKYGNTAIEGGKKLNIATEEGRKNQAALDDLASAAIKVREGQEKMGESTDTIAKKTAEARKKFIEAATQMGLNKEAAEKLADSYGLVPPSVVTRVSAPGATQAKGQVEELIRTIDRFKNLDGTTSTITLNRVTNISTQTTSGGRMATSAATGGYITGPGTGTSDSIPAWLSNGEFVIRAASVQALGLDRLHHMNRYGQLPAFAGGGHVSAGPASYAAPAPVHYAVNVPRYAGGGLVAQPAMASEQAPMRQTVVNVSNHYPVGEPTSVTVNRALEYAAALGV